jgi:enamine deaminase RidA (YjgF/YER057c/UK114 family)
MSFERAFSGAPWEKVVGYCRAVRAGDHIYVTGTTAIGEDGKPFAPGDGYAQACRCIELIERALVKLGADLSTVVRTRMFLSSLARARLAGDHSRARLRRARERASPTSRAGRNSAAPIASVSASTRPPPPWSRSRR